MGELEGKVAFLTGAGRGIGVGISLALAKAGASVGLFGRTRETLEHTAAMLTELGARSLVCVGDVGIRADVDKAVAAVQAKLGPIWALVNNAYSADMLTPLEEVDDRVMEIALRSNVYGSLYTMQACFPTMKERGGRIINFGSGVATMGKPAMGPLLPSYAIAKEAVRGLTKTAAVGWGQYGITVNTICPMASSPAYETWFGGLSEAEKRKHLDGIPLRRVGDGEKDIGGVVVFLASPAGGFVTSRTLHVDGGNCYYDR